MVVWLEGKGKVVSVLKTKHYAMKNYWGSGGTGAYPNLSGL